MSESIYAPPEADVAVNATDEPDFYVVAPRKFYLLSLMTFNLYFVYWFYRNWQRIKQRNDEDIWPPVRGFFYVLFTHALFTDVDIKTKSIGSNFAWRPGLIATVFVVLSIVVNAVGYLPNSGAGISITDYVGVASVPILPIILLKAQRAINFASEDPVGSGNSKLTFANWLWVVLGGIWWLLNLFGAYTNIFAPELLAE